MSEIKTVLCGLLAGCMLSAVPSAQALNAPVIVAEPIAADGAIGEHAAAINHQSGRALLAWKASDTGQGLAQGESEIFVRLVDQLGAEPVAPAFRLSHMNGIGDATYSAGSPAVAYARGTRRWVVVWDGRAYPYDGREVHVRALNEFGTPLGTESRMLSVSGGAFNETLHGFSPAIACARARDECLVAWSQQFINDQGNVAREIHGRLIDTSGTPLTNVYRLSNMGATQDNTRAAHNVQIAYDDVAARYMLVWDGYKGEEGAGTRVYLTTTNNTLTPGATINVTTLGGSFAPRIAWDVNSGRFAISWMRNRDLVAQIWDIYPIPTTSVIPVSRFVASPYRSADAARIVPMESSAHFVVSWRNTRELGGLTHRSIAMQILGTNGQASLSSPPNLISESEVGFEGTLLHDALLLPWSHDWQTVVWQRASSEKSVGTHVYALEADYQTVDRLHRDGFETPN